MKRRVTLIAALVVSASSLLVASVVGRDADAGTSRSLGTIAFTSDGDLFTVRSDGTGRRKLTRAAEYESISSSPDGSQIAFVKDILIGYDRGSEVRVPTIFVIGGDGRGLRRLSPRGKYAEGPVWSRTASRLPSSNKPTSG